MKRKSNKFDTPDAGGWMHKADDLFLARFRGRPCAVCGVTRGFDGSQMIRSMGHHLLSKELHRLYRYDERNIITLCPKHHMGSDMSPHSHDGAAVKAFYDWLEEHYPDKAKFMDEHRHCRFNGEWKYRDAYEMVGGEIATKTGLVKDYRPVNHAKKVREAENAQSRSERAE